MRRFSLSNLQLRSNVLSEDYQRQLRRLTVFEIKNIRERNPMLISPDDLTEPQRQEWREHLFWGERSVSLDDDDRRLAWIERVAQALEDAIASLEDRPDVEGTFEILCVTESLTSLDSHYAVKAEEWGQRARRLLGHTEFRLSPDMIEERLCEILGIPPDQRKTRPPAPQAPLLNNRRELP
jgi:hypothetical protein